MWVGTPLVGPKHRENFKEFGVCEFRYHGGRHSFFLCHPCNLFLWAQKLASQRQVPGPPRARFPGYSPHCASCLPIQPWAGPFRRTRRLSKGNQATASPQVSNEDPSLGDHRATPFIYKKYIYADNGTTVEDFRKLPFDPFIGSENVQIRRVPWGPYESSSFRGHKIKPLPQGSRGWRTS